MKLLRTIKTEFLREELKARQAVDIDFNLAAATNDEILAELNRRFESFLLAYEVELPNRQGKSEVRTSFMWYGSYAQALGLLRYATLRLEESVNSNDHEF